MKVICVDKQAWKHLIIGEVYEVVDHWYCPICKALAYRISDNIGGNACDGTKVFPTHYPAMSPFPVVDAKCFRIIDDLADTIEEKILKEELITI